MRKKTIKIICLISIFLFGCNKFEHEALSIPDCELCDYATTLEGNYRGFVTGVAVPNLGDSMNILLEQVFLGNSQYEDSTFMHFQVIYDFDSSMDNELLIARLDNSNGDFENGYLIVTQDSVVIELDGLTGPTMTAPYIHGTLYRQ